MGSRDISGELPEAFWRGLESSWRALGALELETGTLKLDIGTLSPEPYKLEL